MRLGVLGACDTGGTSYSLKAMLPSHEVKPLIIPTHSEHRAIWFTNLANEFDALAVNKGILSLHKADIESTGLPIKVYPQIFFRAFHPDCCFATLTSDRKLITLANNNAYHSALCLGSFLRGLSINETLELFNFEVFSELGYFDAWNDSVEEMRREFEETEIEFKPFFLKLKRTGAFMHSFNHPKVQTIALLSRYIALMFGASRDLAEREIHIGDGLASLNWPVYPDIGDNYGVYGKYIWGYADKVFDLSAFIVASHQRYEELGLKSDAVVFGRSSSLQIGRSPTFQDRFDQVLTARGIG